MSNFIDYEYDNAKKPTKIIVWEQDYKTNKIVTKKYPIKDYLYFYSDSINENEIIPDLISQRSTQIQKHYATNYEDYKKGETSQQVQSYGFNTYESDIEPKDKCILDNYGKDNQKTPKWNLALYDIETDILADQTFMDMRNNANREITAISVWYSLPNKFFQLTLVPPYLRDFWDYEKVEKRGLFNIFYFDNEKKLLETFFELNKLYEVSAIGAWNADFFDTAYIYKRSLKYWGEEKTANLMGRFSRVRVSKMERGDDIEYVYHPIGMLWYDCLEAYKKNGPELDSFKLNDVAEYELKTHKVDFEGGNSNKSLIKKLQSEIEELKQKLKDGDYEEG
jgi:DNA polymerase elongation subunit (family B)